MIRPDCFNTQFTCVDADDNLLTSTYSLPPAYGIPDDTFTFFPGDELSVTCDLSDKFIPEVLNSDDGPYHCTCTFSSTHQDPDLVDGVCQDPPCVALDVVDATSEEAPPLEIEGDPVVGGASLDIRPAECPNSLNRSPD